MNHALFEKYYSQWNFAKQSIEDKTKQQQKEFDGEPKLSCYIKASLKKILKVSVILSLLTLAITIPSCIALISKKSPSSIPLVYLSTAICTGGFLHFPIFFLIGVFVVMAFFPSHKKKYEKIVDDCVQLQKNCNEYLEQMNKCAVELAAQYMDNIVVQSTAKKISSDFLHMMRYPTPLIGYSEKTYSFEYTFNVNQKSITSSTNWKSFRQHIQESAERYLGYGDVERIFQRKQQQLEEYETTNPKRSDGDLFFGLSFLDTFASKYNYAELPNLSAKVGVAFAIAKLLPGVFKQKYQESDLKNSYVLDSITPSVLTASATCRITIENPYYRKPTELKSW